MDDPLGVGCLETLCDLQEERQRLVDRDRTVLDVLGQGLAIDQLHDQEAGLPLGFKTVQGGDVAVVERSEDTRLTLEPSQTFGVCGDFVEQQLDRDY